MLTQALEQQFQLSNPKCVKYTYFDFHTETKGDVKLFPCLTFILEFPQIE